MTRVEAIEVERARYVEAAQHGDVHLAHIRAATLRRLRAVHEDAPSFDTGYDDERNGERMFGGDHFPRGVAA